ncbi:hypothetical protein ACFX2I_004888 [Malus domestica]
MTDYEANDRDKRRREQFVGSWRSPCGSAKPANLQLCVRASPRTLATGNAKNSFLEDVLRVHDFLIDPSGIRAHHDGKTVQVAPLPPLFPQPVMSSAVGDGYATAIVDDESIVAAASSQAKRAALQRKAAVDMVAAEDFARRFESGYLSDISRGVVVEEQA